MFFIGSGSESFDTFSDPDPALLLIRIRIRNSSCLIGGLPGEGEEILLSHTQVLTTHRLQDDQCFGSRTETIAGCCMHRIVFVEGGKKIFFITRPHAPPTVHLTNYRTRKTSAEKQAISDLIFGWNPNRTLDSAPTYRRLLL